MEDREVRGGTIRPEDKGSMWELATGWKGGTFRGWKAAPAEELDGIVIGAGGWACSLALETAGFWGLWTGSKEVVEILTTTIFVAFGLYLMLLRI